MVAFEITNPLHEYAQTGSAEAFRRIVEVFLLAIPPMIVGTAAFYFGGRSQRGGDVAFASCMVLEGIFLCLGGAGVFGPV